MTFDHHAYQLKRYNDFMNRAIQHLGGKCVQCGRTDHLEIDHIHRATKSFTISNATCYAWHRIEAELVKCQLLCEECHKDKSLRESQTTHGGGTQGIRKCKFELCMEKRRTYIAELRAKKSAT